MRHIRADCKASAMIHSDEIKHVHSGSWTHVKQNIVPACLMLLTVSCWY